MQRTLEKMSEDIAILKTEMIHQRIDINKILSILIESDHALVKRTAVSENNIENLEEKMAIADQNDFNIKVALASLSIGVVGSIAVAMIEFWGRK